MILSYVGMAFDAGAFIKALKAIQPAAEIMDATGDISKFSRSIQLLEEGGEIDAKIAQRVQQAAKTRTGYNNAVKELTRITAGRASMGIDPEAFEALVKMAYWKMREGVTTFDKYVLVVKRHRIHHKLMDKADKFSPEDLTLLKKAWKEGSEGGISTSKPILNEVNTGQRKFSAAYKSLDITDKQHYFSDIIDNYASHATKFKIKGGDGVYRDLYQIEGSLNGKPGIFEWIVEGTSVTHRRFISRGVVNGMPNQIVNK